MSVIIDQNRLTELIANWDGFLIETRDALAMKILQSIIQRFPLQGPGWKRLHPFTVANKGSSSILVDTGQLRDSITIHEQDVGSLKVERRVGVFVYQGYHNQYRQMTNFPQTRQRAILLASLAYLHEFGNIIRVTPRMRAFLHYAGVHLKPTTRYVVIPERSFIRDGFDRVEGELVKDTLDFLELFLLKHAVDVR